eukprot:m.270391 g.270391  ORF g.270391 m.270391 type:complete len:202 (+) comp19736_c0_seq2:102-707(+)
MPSPSHSVERSTEPEQAGDFSEMHSLFENSFSIQMADGSEVDDQTAATSVSRHSNAANVENNRVLPNNQRRPLGPVQHDVPRGLRHHRRVHRPSPLRQSSHITEFCTDDTSENKPPASHTELLFGSTHTETPTVWSDWYSSDDQIRGANTADTHSANVSMSNLQGYRALCKQRISPSLLCVSVPYILGDGWWWCLVPCRTS